MANAVGRGRASSRPSWWGGVLSRPFPTRPGGQSLSLCTGRSSGLHVRSGGQTALPRPTVGATARPRRLASGDASRADERVRDRRSRVDRAGAPPGHGRARCGGTSLARAWLPDQRRGERNAAPTPLPPGQRCNGAAADGAGSRAAQYPRARQDTSGRVDVERPGRAHLSGARRGGHRAELPSAGDIPMNDATQRAWAYLSRVVEPPCAELAALVARVGPVEAADRVRQGHVDVALARRTEARREINCAAEDLDILARRGGRLVIPDDDEWPALAFTAFGGTTVAAKPQGRPPLALWVLGPSRLDDVAQRAAAVVGTRAATSYGEHVAADLAVGLAEHDVAVVSGGAYGIDGAAHRAALSVDGLTVAVLAGGIDIPYPAGHSGLLHRIATDGLLVTEYPPGVPPARHRFLTRNRLVAALAGAAVVVEAGLRSGAANTAAWARALGRIVGAVPGPVTSSASSGWHALLRSGAG